MAKDPVVRLAVSTAPVINAPVAKSVVVRALIVMA